MHMKNLNNDWNYISSFAYAGKNFSVWVQPVMRKDGSFTIAAKTEESSLEEIKKLEQTVTYTNHE